MTRKSPDIQAEAKSDSILTSQGKYTSGQLETQVSAANENNAIYDYSASQASIDYPHLTPRQIELLCAAVIYAAQGWPVFPVHSMIEQVGCSCGVTNCTSAGKHPKTLKGHKAATTDIKMVKRWWGDMHAGANIGCWCKADFWALDVDSRDHGEKKLAALENKYGKLPATVTSLTGGNGFHFLFRKNPACEYRGKVIGEDGHSLTGLDIKAHSGYIVLPPSNHASSGKYHWKEGHGPGEMDVAEAPQWLEDLCVRGKPLPPSPEPQSAGGRSHGHGGRLSNDQIADMLSRIDPDCSYYDWTNVGMALHSEGCRFELWHDWSIKGSKYVNVADCQKHWDTFNASGGIRLGTVIRMAEKEGWVHPQKAGHQDHVEARSHDNDNDIFAPLDMSVIDGSRRRPPELPIDVFGSWAKWIRKKAESTSSPPDYVAMGWLSAVSTLIGNSRCISPWEGWKEPTSLWIAVVGEPSARKSPALDVSLSAIRRLEVEKGKSFDKIKLEYERKCKEADLIKSKWEGAAKEAVDRGCPVPPKPDEATEPEPPQRFRLCVSDTTPEALGEILAGQPRGLLLYRDELSGWLQGFDRYSSGGERSFWLEANGGRAFTIDRVKNNGKPIIIKRLSVGIIGSIQPDKIAEILLKGSDDGMTARFLMCWPEKVRPKRPSSDPTDTGYEIGLGRLLKLEFVSDADGELVPVVKMLTKAAADRFDAWRLANDKAADDVHGMMKGHFGKMDGFVLRLSIVLEYGRWCLTNEDEPEHISEESVAGAIKLVEAYFKPMAARVYGDAALPLKQKNAAMIAREILKRKPKKIKTYSIYRDWGLPGLKEAKPVTEAFDFLVEAGWLAMPDREYNGGKGGRPKTEYLVNPKVYGKDVS